MPVKRCPAMNKNSKYNQLDQEFIKKHKIPHSALFDANGLSKKEYVLICKEKDIPFSYNTSPCKKGGHQIRTRHGHCLVCNPEYLLRYRSYLKKDDEQSNSFNFSIPHKFNGDFVAVDFETATGEKNSICAVGIVVVKNLKITKKLTFLVQPPGNIYWKNNSKIHFIDETKTKNKKNFGELWHDISKYFNKKHIVAHNANFDLNCLKSTLCFYHEKLPAFTTDCTYKIYKQALDKICERNKILLNHHDPLSDAIACAKIYILHLKNNLQEVAFKFDE